MQDFLVQYIRTLPAKVLTLLCYFTCECF